jgi:hypothetical protein
MLILMLEASRVRPPYVEEPQRRAELVPAWEETGAGGGGGAGRGRHADGDAEPRIELRTTGKRTRCGQRCRRLRERAEAEREGEK